MEAVMMNSTGDNKHRFGNPNRNFGSNRTLFPYPSDNLLLSSFLSGGHFRGGGWMSMPPAPAVLGFRPPQHYRQHPPLLPLPISTPINHRNAANNNIRSSPPRINKNQKKKSKNQKKDSKKEVSDLVTPTTAAAEEKQAPPLEKCATESSSINEMIGPDPKDLPKEVVISRVFVDADEFSGSAVFTPSPPPSSLPLPTFSLRSKVSCKAGVDVGATDSLRRLLRL